jgi:hypothetical protein
MPNNELAIKSEACEMDTARPTKASAINEKKEPRAVVHEPEAMPFTADSTRVAVVILLEPVLARALVKIELGTQPPIRYYYETYKYILNSAIKIICHNYKNLILLI